MSGIDPDGWLTSEPVRHLVAAFGGDPSLVDDPVALREFAAATWDFRRGAERDRATPTAFTPEIDALVARASAELGMRDPVPPTRDAYDAILVLGGLMRGCVVRPRTAARLLAGGMTASEVTALGADRPLGDAELELGARLGISASTEAEALEQGMRHAFAARGLATPTRVLTAPPAPGAARADTRATFRHWADGTTARTVLLITHPIYVPYQHAVALGTFGLESGMRVETIGVTDEDADLGPDTGTFRTQDYLQETLSAITALVDLRERLGRPRP